MNDSRKGFFKGLFVGIMLSLFMGVFAVGLGVFILKNPHGRLATIVFGKSNQFGLLTPVFSAKKLAINTLKDLKTPELKVRFPLAFQEVPFAGTRVEKSGSLTSWIAYTSDRVQIDSSPPPEKVKGKNLSRPIVLRGLKGETLSFQLVLRSKRDLDDVHVSIVQGADSQTSCIQFHRFKEIFLKVMLQNNGNLKKIINPDPLVPFSDPYTPGRRLIKDLKLTEDQNQPVWIDVHYSRTCRSGDYSGKIQIVREGKILRSSKLIFHISPQTLPNHLQLSRWMQLYIGRFNYGEGQSSSEAQFANLFSRYYALGNKYGFATGDCGTLGPTFHWDDKGSLVSVDWSSYDYIEGPVLSGNLTGSPPNAWCFPLKTYSLGNFNGFTYQGRTPSDINDWKGIPERSVEQLAKAVVQHWKEKGWSLSKGFDYIWDEPDHQLYYPYIYDLIANISVALHKGSDNQIKTMVTDTPYIWNRHQVGHHKHVMYNKIDIWAPGAAVYIPDKIQKYKDDGKKTWFYTAGPPFLGQSDLTGKGPGFRMWFWTAWKYNVNGVFYWASDFWSGNTVMDSPYTKGGSEDGVVFYPGHQLHFLGIPDIDGPVPSVRMAQWRRGVEDYKYFLLLKMDGQEKYIDSLISALIPNALNVGGYLPAWKHPLGGREGDWNHDPKVWHMTRIEMLRKIENK